MKITAIILAAGFSSRMNAFKPEVLIRGVPLIRLVVENALSAIDDAVVVTGFQGERVRELLSGQERVRVVDNPDFERGMFSSVLAGIHALNGPDGFFIQPGDMPLISAQTYRGLLAAGGKIRVPVYQSRRGHPVFFDGMCAAEIEAFDPAATLRDYIMQNGRVEVPTDDEGILLDVDTPEDVLRVVEILQLKEIFK